MRLDIKTFRFLYYTILSILVLTLLTYHLFDYVGYFENKYGIDKLNTENQPVYAIYEIRMGNVLFWYRTIFFGSVLTLVFLLLYSTRNHTRTGLPKRLSIVLLTLTFVYIIGIFILGTVFGATII